MKDIAIFVSSLTGNTQKIADAIKSDLEQKDYSVVMQDSCMIMKTLTSAQFYILCFWCRRTSLDDNSKKLLAQYKNTPFLAIGTCGHYPDSNYGNKVKKNVTEYINDGNLCIDVFLSQGAVSLSSTERRRKLPVDHPHHLDDDGYERHMESQNHPNETDIKNVIDFLNSYLQDSDH